MNEILSNQKILCWLFNPIDPNAQNVLGDEKHGMGVGVWFRTQSLGFRLLGFRVQGLRIQGLGMFRVVAPEQKDAQTVMLLMSFFLRALGHVKQILNPYPSYY